MNLEVPCNRNEPDYPCVAPRWVKAAFHFPIGLLKPPFCRQRQTGKKKKQKRKHTRAPGLEKNWNYKRGKKNCRGLKNQ